MKDYFLAITFTGDWSRRCMSVFRTLRQNYENDAVVSCGSGGRRPAHHGLSLLRAAPHVVALALSPVDGTLALQLLLTMYFLLCCALGFRGRLTRGELLLCPQEGAGLCVLVLVLFDIRCSRSRR
jgi:hypothetical protein